MNDQQQAERYLKYLPMVEHLAHRLGDAHTRIELVECGYDSLVRMVFSQDKPRSKGTSETTRIYRGIQWDMLSLLRRKRRLRADSRLLNECKAPERYWLDRIIDEVSEDAQIVLSIVLNAPTEIIEDMVPRRRASARKAIRWYLLRRLGWSATRVDQVWNELSQCL